MHDFLQNLQSILQLIGGLSAGIGLLYAIVVWIILDPLGFFGGIWFPILAIINFYMHVFNDTEKFEPAAPFLFVGALCFLVAGLISP